MPSNLQTNNGKYKKLNSRCHKVEGIKGRQDLLMRQIVNITMICLNLQTNIGTICPLIWRRKMANIRNWTVIVPQIICRYLRCVSKCFFVSGLHGPEGSHPKDGQYDYHLIDSSSQNGAITNMNDAKLCPGSFYWKCWSSWMN